MGLIWGFEAAERLEGGGRVCVAKACLRSVSVNCDSRAKILAAAHLAESAEEWETASELYEKMLNCLLIVAGEHHMIPRMRRWELADAYTNLAKVLVVRDDLDGGK